MTDNKPELKNVVEQSLSLNRTLSLNARPASKEKPAHVKQYDYNKLRAMFWQQAYLSSHLSYSLEESILDADAILVEFDKRFRDKLV